MPRLSFIYRTDTHVCDRNPASWKGDYAAEIWDNLIQIGKYAKEYDADAVLDGGDYFHIKSASRNPHSLVVQSAKIHRGYRCPTLTVPGNHDISYNNLETLERQPLGVLLASEVFIQMTEHVFSDGQLQVRVVGMPYSPFRTLADLRAIKKKPGDTFLVAVVHALAGDSPPASVEDFFGEPVFDYADLVSEDGPDVWCFGHWHKDQGIVEIGTQQFVNLGAVSRGALVRENLHRTPKVAYIEADPSGIRVVPLPLIVAPAEDVFDLERKERQEKEDTNIDQFIGALQASTTFDATKSIEDNLAALDFATDVRDLAKDYLERARAEVG
jgi:DNA repair exonuclease SbcCD nuclease subunit